jgi:hypothetical protein
MVHLDSNACCSLLRFIPSVYLTYVSLSILAFSYVFSLQMTFNKISTAVKNIFEYVPAVVWKFIVLYITWVSMYFISSQLHSYYCTPFSWHGYLFAPFISESPHCIAFRWGMNNGSIKINTMWEIISKTGLEYTAKLVLI